MKVVADFFNRGFTQASGMLFDFSRVLSSFVPWLSKVHRSEVNAWNGWWSVCLMHCFTSDGTVSVASTHAYLHAHARHIYAISLYHSFAPFALHSYRMTSQGILWAFSANSSNGNSFWLYIYSSTAPVLLFVSEWRATAQANAQNPPPLPSAQGRKETPFMSG